MLKQGDDAIVVCNTYGRQKCIKYIVQDTPSEEIFGETWE